MNPTRTEVPAPLAAMQDQLDDLVAIVQAQKRTTDSLVTRRHRVDGTGGD